MSRRYVILFAFTLAVAVALSVVSRLPNRGETEVAPAADRPPEMVTLDIEDGTVSPAETAVEKGSRVVLAVTNRGDSAVRFALGGYEDVVERRIGPGETWSRTFAAVRPGEDFAWLVDGAPAGRFVVRGSHLEEGHQ